MEKYQQRKLPIAECDIEGLEYGVINHSSVHGVIALSSSINIIWDATGTCNHIIGFFEIEESMNVN